MPGNLPLGLALGSPIFPSGCEGKLGVALESLQGLRDLTYASQQLSGDYDPTHFPPGQLSHLQVSA